MTANYSNNIINCSGIEYIVTVVIEPDYKMAGAIDNAAAFDGQSIEEICYTSALNALIVTGYVICVDKFGMLDRFIEDQQCKCNIMIAEAKKKVDDGQFSDNLPNKKRMFSDSFIVNQIHILERHASFIKYKIDIVSLNWYSCAANIQYSNNDKDPEPIFSIIKTCLKKQDLVVDDASFDNVKSNVKMNYITKLNDNLFTAVPYLMHKLFFLPEKDQSMKFIVYSWFDKKYYLIDLANNTTFLHAATTTLSFFKSNVEALIQQFPSNLGSFTNAIGNVKEYNNMFDKDMYAYDINKNAFVNNGISQKNIVQYMNAHASFDNYVPKYHEVDVLKSLKYFQSHSYWNAGLNVYNDSMRSIIENGSIVINMTGNVMLQCGMILNIGLDRDMNALTDDSKRQLEKMKVKYKVFEGPWLISNVTSHFYPMTRIFRQNVALFRNFTFKKEKLTATAL